MTQIRNAVKEINTLKAELREIKNLIKEIVKQNGNKKCSNNKYIRRFRTAPLIVLVQMSVTSASLGTTDTSSIVAAINEINTSVTTALK